eukprot:1831263-Amphidinium_carterae.1
MGGLAKLKFLKAFGLQRVSRGLRQQHQRLAQGKHPNCRAQAAWTLREVPLAILPDALERARCNLEV